MKNEEKTTTYTASDLPEEIHSEEPAKDAETTGNADTVKTAEVKSKENTEAESESIESETVESVEDTEVGDSGTTIENSEVETDENETAKEAANEEDSEDSEKGGVTRGKLVKIFAMEVLAFVIFIFAIIAWFSMNEDVSTTGMQIKVQAPDGIFISLGKTNSTYSINDEHDTLVLKNDNTPDDPEEADWASEIDIDNYYKFGKMIPASSTDGEHIYFTPDAISAGRDVKSTGRYFQADGNVDGYLKDYIANGALPSSTDNDSLAVTAYAFTTSDASDKGHAWTDYERKQAWNDTNDDGYYVDIPIWIKSNGTATVNLVVKGIVNRGPNTLNEPTDNATTEPLYKATRVALLDGTTKAPLGGTVEDENTHETMAAKIIPLMSSVSTLDNWASGTSILDSYNYNTTRGTTNSNLPLWGVSEITSGTTTGVYSNYTAYNASTTNILTLNGSEPSEKKVWIRVWLDGEDKGCWNPNAGQDWTISLRFEKR